MENNEWTQAVVSEALRIEEDTLHSMKGHFNAAMRWRHVHLCLGLPSAVLAVCAGLQSFSDCQWLTAILAMLSAGLVAASTFLEPQKITAAHQSAGREYNALRNKVRRFREINMPCMSESEIRAYINDLAERRDYLNSNSPDIPRWAYEKAKQDIDGGMAEYKVDKEAGHER